MPLDEIGKDGLVLSGQKVLKRPFEGFTVGEIDAELFAEENKIAPRIPITPRKLVDQLFNAGRALGNNFPVLAAAEDHRLVEGARQLRPEVGRWRFPPLARRIAAAAFSGFDGFSAACRSR